MTVYVLGFRNDCFESKRSYESLMSEFNQESFSLCRLCRAFHQIFTNTKPFSQFRERFWIGLRILSSKLSNLKFRIKFASFDVIRHHPSRLHQMTINKRVKTQKSFVFYPTVCTIIITIVTRCHITIRKAKPPNKLVSFICFRSKTKL